MALIEARRLLASPNWTVTAILVGNLIPVGGVAFLGWDAAQILMLYWAENIVLGFLTLPRILAAQGDKDPSKADSFATVRLGCFFSVHYGVFCLGHLVFAMGMASDFIRADGRSGTVWENTFGDPNFQWAIVGLAAVHIVMQFRDWWMVRAWRDASPTLEMFQPYGRIFVLHLTVLFGAWLMLGLKSPAWAVLILCLGKAVLELIGAVLTGRVSLARRP